MSDTYSQSKALFALIKASLRSLLKSPSSVVFSLAFPMAMILVFGVIGSKTNSGYNVALAPGSDSTQSVWLNFKANPMVKIVQGSDSALKSQLEKGSLTAILKINAIQQHTNIEILTNIPEQSKAHQLALLIQNDLIQKDNNIQQQINAIASIKETLVSERAYKYIDFILPGQLGFSILAASIFGTAFVFFHLRQMLVLKRFFATPVKKSNILLAEGISRMIFQLVGSLILIAFGKYLFGFTLIHGIWTILEMLLLSALALLIFMSFGFIISGLAKSDSSIPPLANIVVMPQFLMAGTFFPISAFPSWLQPICKIMPLTFYNDAIRMISFDGANLWDVKWKILSLVIWGIIGYFVASKTFKWE